MRLRASRARCRAARERARAWAGRREGPLPQAVFGSPRALLARASPPSTPPRRRGPRRRPWGRRRGRTVSTPSSSRYSARDVKRRYGSSSPFFVRSSTMHRRVGLGALEHERLLPPDRERGVDARQDSLRRGLLVARRAVDLPGEKEPGTSSASSVSAQLIGKDEVVLDGVAGSEHPRARRARESRRGSRAARPRAATSRGR